MVASLSNPSSPPLPAAADAVDVLLVDDQPARRLTYRAILEPLGETLIEATSGTDALRQLMTRECAVILLDVNMPDIDGFETASLIHQHPRFEKTPIIFVTAVNVSDLDRIRGYALGAVDYVTVPIIPEILRSKVTVLCELHRKRLQLQLANEQLAAANEALRMEKARELELLNDSLRVANDTLAASNKELQAQVAEREKAEQSLLELGRRKDEFLATLAHELRNPLASLGNAINILKLSAREDNPLRQTMERQLGLLVRLIDDLLDAARIGRGKLALKPVTIALNSVIDSAVETVAPLLAANGRVLQMDLALDGVVLQVDRERLSQVFSNLLSNAVKYSDPGAPIVLSGKLAKTHVEVSVADSGLGLTPEQSIRIFEPFTQLETSIERSLGGLGIGLTLARRIVEMHGGHVQVHSEGPNRGSCFVVHLPLGTAMPVEPPRSLAAGEEVAPNPSCRALIIDDNRDSADTLAMMLELLGHETRCVYDPLQSVDAAAEFRPDVVFLDIGMPRMSGHEVARVLRADPSGRGLTIVAVTGWGQPEERRLTREAGFDHHLVKPVEMAVIQRICNAVHGARRCS